MGSIMAEDQLELPNSSSSSSPISDPPPLHDNAAADATATLSHGFASTIGKRNTMEDNVTVSSLLVSAAAAAAGLPSSCCSRYELFAVYDGHGGAAVSEACRDRLHVVLAQEAAAAARISSLPAAAAAATSDGENEWWREVFRKSFLKMDEEVADISASMSDSRGGSLGSTAVVAAIGRRTIVVANCGDSRAVLCRHGVPLPLSSDHKPYRSDEKERIEAAGGLVVEWKGSRVMGVLGTSRSIGDHHLKPFVSAEPEVTITHLMDKDEFVIIASDGLWDVVSNQEACKLVRRCLFGKNSKDTTNICRAKLAATRLARLAISSGSHDNVTVVVVQLK